MADEKLKLGAADVFIGGLLMIFVAAPLTGLMQAWSAHVLWKWFLFQDYGPGPSLRAWFGVACLVSLMTMFLKREKPSEGGVIHWVFSLTFMEVGLTMVVLGMAAAVRWVVGW